MKQKYLFLFTIGPVQSFISQARKTQDLYAGSRLLSDLTKYAIQKSQELADNIEIRFPADFQGDALPNRYLAEVELKKEDLSAFGHKIENAVKEKFKNIGNDILKELRINKVPGFDWQIENHLNIFWVFEPLSGKTYREAFTNIESNLASLKNFRMFQQMPESEQHRKCSLSGEYDALFFGKEKHKFANKNAIAIRSKKHLFLLNEGLSAISFMKRFYKSHMSFPSTAKICALTIKEIENCQELVHYRNLFKGNFDDQLLYQENLTPTYFYKQGLIHLLGTNTETVENLKGNGLIGDILRSLVKDNLKPFSDAFKKVKGKIKDEKLKLKSYYAILMIDTDDMGKWLTNPDIQDLKSYHKNFSQYLSQFAAKAKQYLDEGRGKTIYAGGDDFIGLVNLDSLFDVLKKLNRLFKEMVSDKLVGNIPNKQITFSAGIAIAHYKEPLGEVLKRTRAMEKKAKSVDGKASFAIGVMKHSGEISGFVRKWGPELKYIQDIEFLLESLNKEQISPAFISNLERTFSAFNFEKHPENFDPMFSTESRRLIARATDDKDKEEKKAIIDSIHRIIVDIQIDQGYKGCTDVLDAVDFIYRKS